jgi:hypothetical protein
MDFPEDILSPDAIDIIDKLIRIEPNERLGVPFSKNDI